MVFTRDLSEPLTSLVKKMDSYAKEHKGFKCWVVVVADQQQNEAKVKELAQKNGLSLPMAFFADGPSGDQANVTLKLNPQVKYTVLAYKDKQVKSNFALDEITDAATANIVKAADAIAQ